MKIQCRWNWKILPQSTKKCSGKSWKVLPEGLRDTVEIDEKHRQTNWETSQRNEKFVWGNQYKGLEAEEMLPKGLWIQTGETFWEDEEKREQMDAEREYRLNPEYMI